MENGCRRTNRFLIQHIALKPVEDESFDELPCDFTASVLRLIQRIPISSFPDVLGSSLLSMSTEIEMTTIRCDGGEPIGIERSELARRSRLFREMNVEPTDSIVVPFGKSSVQAWVSFHPDAVKSFTECVAVLKVRSLLIFLSFVCNPFQSGVSVYETLPRARKHALRS